MTVYTGKPLEEPVIEYKPEELKTMSDHFVTMLGGGPAENFQGWDKVDPRFLTPSRKRWIKNGGKMGKLSRAGGGYIREMLEEQSWWQRLMPACMEGGQIYPKVSYPQQFAGPGTEKPGDKICGWSAHIKPKTNDIFPHWHCTHYMCSKLHKTEKEALGCHKVKRDKQYQDRVRDKKQIKAEKRARWNYLHHSTDISGKRMTVQAMLLLTAIHDIKGDWYFIRSWSDGLEYRMWQDVIDPDDNCGAENIFKLAKAANGWWIDTGSPGYGPDRFIPMSEWEKMYAEWFEKTGGKIAV